MLHLLMALKRKFDASKEQAKSKKQKTSRSSRSAAAPAAKRLQEWRRVNGRLRSFSADHQPANDGGQGNENNDISEAADNERDADLVPENDAVAEEQDVPGQDSNQENHDVRLEDGEPDVDRSVPEQVDESPDDQGFRPPFSSPAAPSKSEQFESARDYFFKSDEPTNYTNGMSRMVVIEDENRELPAIMPSSKFADKMKDAASLERELRRLLKLESAQIQAEDRLVEIRNNTEPKLLFMRQEYEKLEGHQDVLDEVVAKIETLYDDLAQAQNNRGSTRAEIDELMPRWELAQSRVAATLDLIFIKSHLVERPLGTDRTQTESKDEAFYFPFEAEHLELLARQREATERSQPPVPTADESQDSGGYRRRRAEALYFNATGSLHRAQQAFDARSANYRREADAHNKKIREGITPSETSIEFDMRHFKRRQELTHRLIEKEEAFRARKYEALEAGANIQHSQQSSGFLDRQSDGPGSGDNRPPMNFNWRRIEQWRRDVPTGQNAADPAEADDDQARTAHDSEWEFSDDDLWATWSAAEFEDSHRRRIDKWQATCDELPKHPLEQQP